MKPTIDASKIFDYTSKYDRDDPPTVFHLGILTSKEQAYIQEQTSRVIGYENNPKDKKLDKMLTRVDVNLGLRLQLVVQLGLRGWDNAQNPDGTPLQFQAGPKDMGRLGTRTVMTDAQYETLHPSLIEELAEQIDKASTLQEAEAKN